MAGPCARSRTCPAAASCRASRSRAPRPSSSSSPEAPASTPARSASQSPRAARPTPCSPWPRAAPTRPSASRRWPAPTACASRRWSRSASTSSSPAAPGSSRPFSACSPSAPLRRVPQPCGGHARLRHGRPRRRPLERLSAAGPRIGSTPKPPGSAGEERRGRGFPAERWPSAKAPVGSVRAAAKGSGDAPPPRRGRSVAAGEETFRAIRHLDRDAPKRPDRARPPGRRRIADRADGRAEAAGAARAHRGELP